MPSLSARALSAITVITIILASHEASAVSIPYFSATAQASYESGEHEVLLEWRVDGGSSVEIVGISSVPPSGSLTIRTSQTSFSLQVVDSESRQHTRSVSLFVPTGIPRRAGDVPSLSEFPISGRRVALGSGAPEISLSINKLLRERGFSSRVLKAAGRHVVITELTALKAKKQTYLVSLMLVYEKSDALPIELEYKYLIDSEGAQPLPEGAHEAAEAFVESFITTLVNLLK